ncbi:MAG: CPBP family intramembrane metalloprotease [Methanobrevibacter sp.]|nr:CPBP family intramembrane metalloprotease [Methanobrevibacter sp.]
MNSDKKFFSKIGINYLTYAIATIIIQIIVINMLRLFNNGILNDFNAVTIVSAICSYVLPLPLMIFLMKKLESERLEKHSLNPKTFISYITIALTLMWIGNIVGLTVTSLIGFVTQTEVINPIHELINSSDIWINLMLISMFGPIFEEIFFRKLLIDRTIKYGARLSVILSAVMFGLFHGNISQFFYATLIGGFFAYVYIKTGNLIYPILLHMILNFLGSVVSLFVMGSAENLASGGIMLIDLFIVISYALIMAVAITIGLRKLIMSKNIKLDHIKTKITLREPFKTVVLNYGMIMFTGFCIFEIIRQLSLSF